MKKIKLTKKEFEKYLIKKSKSNNARMFAMINNSCPIAHYIKDTYGIRRSKLEIDSSGIIIWKNENSYDWIPSKNWIKRFIQAYDNPIPPDADFKGPLTEIIYRIRPKQALQVLREI